MRKFNCEKNYNCQEAALPLCYEGNTLEVLLTISICDPVDKIGLIACQILTIISKFEIL